MEKKKLSERITAANWYKGGLHNQQHTKWCVLGHMTDEEARYVYVEPMSKVIRELFPERVDLRFTSVIVGFNDHPDTTFDQLMKVIEETERRIQ